LLGENVSGNKKLAQPSRKNVRGKDPTLQKGELALSVPRLGLRDIPVPVGSTQAELDREGIIRIGSSGVPWDEGSNTFIVGHRLGYLRTRITYVFYRLDKMRRGDKIFVEDAAGRKYTYKVYDYMTVRPVDRWVMYPVDGMTTISLVTCTPIPTFENRFVVRGELVRVSS
jgi:sortase A